MLLKKGKPEWKEMSVSCGIGKQLVVYDIRDEVPVKLCTGYVLGIKEVDDPVCVEREFERMCKERGIDVKKSEEKDRKELEKIRK